jgi:hypothetical protein
MEAHEAESLRRWAERRLAELEAGAPPGAGGLERLWTLYHLGVGEEERLDEARALAAELRSLADASRSRGIDASGTPGAEAPGLEGIVVEALGGAVEVARAKYTRWPPSKLQHLRTGMETLDRLAADRPDDLRVRYLRLVSGFYVPFFVKREEVVREDLRVLAAGLPERPEGFSPSLFVGVARFVLEHGDPTPEERRRLVAALREKSPGEAAPDPERSSPSHPQPRAALP